MIRPTENGWGVYLTSGREHDIFRLDVTVDDAAFVRGCESFDALRSDVEEFLQ